MNTNKRMSSLAALSLAGLLATTPALAGMGPCPSGGAYSPSPSACPTGPQRSPACPREDSAGNKGGCLDREALLQSAGQMAASGIGIAATVMRTLLNEADRIVGTGQRM